MGELNIGALVGVAILAFCGGFLFAERLPRERSGRPFWIPALRRGAGSLLIGLVAVLSLRLWWAGVVGIPLMLIGIGVRVWRWPDDPLGNTETAEPRSPGEDQGRRSSTSA